MDGSVVRKWRRLACHLIHEHSGGTGATRRDTQEWRVLELYHVV